MGVNRSYLAPKGSTLRMDWKTKSPNQYALYFQCSSMLVSTFKMVYGNTFNYEGNRAIVFQLEDKLPVEEVKKLHPHRFTIPQSKTPA